MSSLEKLAGTKETPDELVFIFERHKDIVQDDSVFEKIFESLKNGWGGLTQKQRNDISGNLNDLISALKEYRASYSVLKSKSKKLKEQENFTNLKDYQEQIKMADQQEKQLHDSFVDSINILSRNMKKVGLDNSWRGYEEIWGGTPETNRIKAKLWMFKIFGK